MPDESPKKRKKHSSDEEDQKDKKRRKKDSDSEDDKDVKKSKTEPDKAPDKTVEKEIEELCRERSRIEDALRRMEENHKKFILTLEANELRKIKQEEEKKKAAGKKSRESDNDSSGDEKEKKKEDKDEKDGKDKKRRSGPMRERALFGFLQNHLKKAKKDFDDEKGPGSKKDKVDLEKPVGEVKLSAQSRSQVEAKEKGFKDRKSKEMDRLHEIDRTIQEKEAVLLQGRLEKHYTLMMNFIRTKAEPTIFYLPAKHTSTTEKILEETRQAIKNKIASLSVQLQPLDPPEDLANGLSKDERDDDKDEKQDDKKDGSDSDGEEDSIPEGAPRNREEAGDDDKSEKSDKSDGE